MRRDPRVAVNVVDPADAFRIATVRGRVVAVTTDGADRQLDQLARKYVGAATYPWRTPGETRVLLQIVAESIHATGLDE